MRCSSRGIRISTRKANPAAVQLKSSRIPKCEGKNIIGHSFEQGLDDYDSGDENEQRIMSNISKMPQMQDKYSNLSPQCKLL